MSRASDDRVRAGDAHGEACAADLARALADLPARSRLAALVEAFVPAPDKADRVHNSAPASGLVLTTSLGPEDQLLTHWIATDSLPIALVTLDTGRLFEESQTLWAETEARYGRRIRGAFPDPARLAELVADQGPNGFRYGVAMRKACCQVRKVEPLERALKSAQVWITGLRGDQSAQRGATELVRWDARLGVIKVNPLIDWTHAQVHAACVAEGVPLNPLHALGYVSIGCAPCTRAIAPGEAERAGRWWWEQGDSARECGLHPDDGHLDASHLDDCARAARPQHSAPAAHISDTPL